MKTATIKINLYTVDELSEKSKQRAIEEHFNFLSNEPIEVEDENGVMSYGYVEPTKDEVLENIRVNEYLYFNTGKLANTTKFTGKHPLSGSTVFEFKNIRVFI